MCSCKKNSRLEPLLGYLEGYFDCVGSPYDGDSVHLDDIYDDLLTSLYQLDDNGNKVIISCSTDDDGSIIVDEKFIIDVNRPVYIGSLRDNSDSNCGSKISNAYNDIVSLGFKPTNPKYRDVHHLLSSFIIDAEEDSVLPISYDEAGDYYVFSNNVKALCLPKVNFYIYRKSDGEGGYVPTFNGGFGIKRDGSEKTGYYDSNFEFEETGAIDLSGNFISRAKVSVLMLPTDNYGNKFELFGHSNGEPDSDFDDKIEEYYFDGSIGYGEEVDAKGRRGLAKVRFVNEDERYANLVPTDSCQFIGQIFNEDDRDEVWNRNTHVYLGSNWDSGVNDEAYCGLDSPLYLNSDMHDYTDRSVDAYIRNSLNIGLYNTRHFGDAPMYLYNIGRERFDNIYIRDNTLEVPVKRLPVVNLTGRLSKSKFDSYKPYIYIFKPEGKDMPACGVFLCEYKDLDSDLIFQVAENYRWLSERTEFIIFCSDIKVDSKTSLIILKGMTVSASYRLTCQPTEMNEDVVYDITPLR